MKTRTVAFSFGTVKNAALKIPAEAYSIVDAVTLIRESYIAYAFRPGCGLMSDECVTSSIGQANFFAGALGGYEERIDAERFAAMKSYASELSGLAIMVAAFRNPKGTKQDHYRAAAKNEALDESTRRFLALVAEQPIISG